MHFFSPINFRRSGKTNFISSIGTCSCSLLFTFLQWQRWPNHL